MSEKHCLKCKWLVVDAGTTDYSDVTPGDLPSIWCIKHHWSVYPTEGQFDKRSLREKMETANTCPDYAEGD